MDIKKVLIVGGGTMGRDIAIVIAEAGINVKVSDVSVEAAEKAIKNIEQRLDKRIEKQEITREKKTYILSLIKPAVINDASDSDIVIEAVVEDIKVKNSIFKQLGEVCSSRTILATNTSALSVTKIAESAANPERIIGLHFTNPVIKMKLVEIIRTKKTSGAVFSDARTFIEKIGKTPVEVNESPGFILNRLLIPMINEAITMLSTGVAEKEAIDTAMKLGAAHPMGPLALADMIGLDVCLIILKTLERDLKDAKYHPSPLLEEMVKQGKLGRKTKEGFYKY